MQYVVYYRVSTNKQASSGLGLDAQRECVKGFVKDKNQIISEFTDIESGKKSERKALQQAITLAKKENATLLVAKLDRLSRNVMFINQLLASKVKFVCCDMPDANELTINIIASIAQHERNLISTRTSDALQALKAKHGTVYYKKGHKSNLNDEAREKAYQTIRINAKNNPNNKTAKKFAKSLAMSGLKPAQILKELQEGEFKTSTGKPFTQITQVKRLLED